MLMCFMSFGSGSVALAGDDWGQFGRYHEENAQVLAKSETECAPKAVFMGNSITEGWVREDPRFFLLNNFVGRGISGQTTYQMLLRFREDVINLHPEAVVINGGTNDIAENNHDYSEDITFGNIVSMAELAQANGIRVILTSVLPVEKFYWRPSVKDVPAKVSSLNARIRQYADEHDIPFVDYFEVMHTPSGALNPALSPDGVHPNLDGYRLMEPLVLNQIILPSD